MRQVLMLVGGVLAGFVLANVAISALYWWHERNEVPPPPHLAFLRGALQVKADRIDFTSLNNGNWSWLCLFGPGTRPVDFVRTESARRGETADIQIRDARPGAPREIGALGAQDGALSVVDPLGYVAIVLFAGLEPIAGLKGPVCAERKDPVISLAGK